MQLGMVAIYPNQFWRGEAEGASEDEKVEYEQHILNSNIKYNNVQASFQYCRQVRKSS
jgi:hypothetical protein